LISCAVAALAAKVADSAAIATMAFIFIICVSSHGGAAVEAALVPALAC
jgi:hypothetical protein